MFLPKSRRKSRGEHVDLGGVNDGDGVSYGIQDAGALMKAGRVPLVKIKTGVKVGTLLSCPHVYRVFCHVQHHIAGIRGGH